MYLVLDCKWNMFSHLTWVCVRMHLSLTLSYLSVREGSGTENFPPINCKGDNGRVLMDPFWITKLSFNGENKRITAPKIQIDSFKTHCFVSCNNTVVTHDTLVITTWIQPFFLFFCFFFFFVTYVCVCFMKNIAEGLNNFWCFIEGTANTISELCTKCVLPLLVLKQSKADNL